MTRFADDDDLLTRPRSQSAARPRTKPPGKWRVVLHNDDYTPIDFVVDVVQTIFNKSFEEAMDVTIAAHNKGSAEIDQYSKDVAETKCADAIGYSRENGHALLVTAEEV